LEEEGTCAGQAKELRPAFTTPGLTKKEAVPTTALLYIRTIVHVPAKSTTASIRRADEPCNHEMLAELELVDLETLALKRGKSETEPVGFPN